MRTAVCACWLMLLCCRAEAEPIAWDRLDQALEQTRQAYNVPGMAIAVVDGGEIVYSRGFGVSDAETDEPISDTTLFHAASISKTFTTAAILKLAMESRLSLDDSIEQYLSEFKGSGIKIRHLLTHTSGLRDRERASGQIHPDALRDHVRRVAITDSESAIGEGWAYADANFNVLGALIEVVTGQPFAVYMMNEVLRPLGMERSTFDARTLVDAAWPHEGEILVRRTSQHPWDPAFAPSSGLQTNAHELCLWALAHLTRDSRLLEPEQYDVLFTPVIPTEWDNVQMGLGWQLEARDASFIPRHAGGDVGFRALLTLYPEQRRAIVILSNGESTPRFDIRAMIEAFLDGHSIAAPRPPSLPLRYPLLTTAVAFAVLLAALLIWRVRSRRVSRLQRDAAKRL